MRLPLIFLVGALALTASAVADVTEAEPNITRREDVLDPAKREHLQIIRRSISDEIPEGFTVRRLVEIHLDVNDGRLHERQRVMEVLDEEGRKHGPAVYHERGYLGRFTVFQYDRGVRNGMERSFHNAPDRGRVVREEVPWVNGEIHGERMIYHPNGQINIISTFNRGVPGGARKTYCPEGKLTEIVGYKDGQMHGERIQYWPGTEQPRRIVPYNMGEVQGVVRDFHQDGKVRREMPYRNSMLHGIERHIDEQGNVTRERYWLDDESVPKGRFEAEFKD